ncbi:MAG: hypothetical protein IJ035_01865 [Oscillospiraceae bacterium]|nr:hypothetical protein [Oscillospiraceae bacterium]
MAPAYDKKKQIELQNIIFGTAEKKLMVSPEFLEEMTKRYISKRMKAINQNMEGIAATKSPKNFFSYIDSIFQALDELIVLQNYHTFKEPIPSVVKNALIAKKGRYIIAMFNRVWKEANLKAKYDARTEQPRRVEDFGPVLDELLAYMDQYTPDSIEVLNKFYSSVYGHNIGEEPPVVEEEEVPTDDMLLEEDEFVEEEFPEAE